ncbi:MAG TPA: PilN domain-containing protein [Longimicrobiales bacterium]
MIEINLLPGAERRRSGRSIRLPAALRNLAAGVKLDRWAAFIGAAWIIGPGSIVWLYLSTAHHRHELTLAVEQAVQDSTRYAKLIQAQDRLIARRDTIAQKLKIIQEIDADRYVWPHIMDEIARALPDYTWLTKVTHMNGGGPDPQFQIVGRAGNVFALTRFMKDLEASPFIRSVRLTTTERVRDADNREVHEFILLASYEPPPPTLIETVPLFAAEE